MFEFLTATPMAAQVPAPVDLAFLAGIFLIGALAGAGVGYFLSATGARSKSAALRERLNLLEKEKAQGAALQEENQRLRQNLMQAQARHEFDHERLQWKENSEHQLRESFQNIAHEIFSDVMRDNRDQADASSKASLEKVVEPIRLTLAHLDMQVRELEQERQGAYQGLRRELHILRDAQNQLQTSTRDLRQALSTSSGSRGRWGEIQLQRLIEMAGMTRHVDYVEQATLEGGLRPDLIVRLPGGATLPIDAKTPLRAYLKAAEEDDKAGRDRRLDEHLRSLKARAHELGSKAYWRAVPGAADFVVMFLPHDGVLAAAFERDPDLLDYCLERRVLPATPVTLLALLRAVAWGWQRQHIAEGAEKIAAAGREVHARLHRLIEHFQRTGRGLDAAVQAYNETIGSLERRLLPAVRRLEEAGALEESLEAPAPVTKAARPPSSEP